METFEKRRKSSLDEGQFPIQKPTANELINNFTKMQIIPSITLKNGRAVIYNEKTQKFEDQGDPLLISESFSLNTDMLFIDLDYLENKGNNINLIKKISMKYPCYAGGYDNLEKINELLSNNIKRVEIFPKNKDIMNMVHSNKLILRLYIDFDLNVYFDDETKINFFQYIETIQNNINYISIHFKFEPVNENQIKPFIERISNELKKRKIKVRIALAYYFSSVEQIKYLVKNGIVPILRNNFWKNNITFGDIFSQIIDYEKLKKFSNEEKLKETPILVPVVVIDNNDNMPLGLVFTTKEGIKKTVDEKICYFFSKELNQLINPNNFNSNGIKNSINHFNKQYLRQISVNCDRTSLLFLVNGNYFCKNGNNSCFNWNKTFNGGMRDLEKIIKHSVKYGGEKSYTKKIASNKDLVLCKVIEEANEVWCASNSTIENLSYEISDLIYFLTIFCVSCHIDIDLLYMELIRRHFSHYKSKQKKINNDLKEIRLGMSISKYYQDNLFEFLDANGLEIKKENKYKYTAKFKNDNNIKIKAFIIKPKDVYRFIENNLMESVICYQDILDNYPCNYERIQFQNNLFDENKDFLISKICVISNIDFNIEEYKKNSLKKLVIFSEYNYLTTKWVDQNEITAKIVVVHGANEGHLIKKLCDLIVCVVSTGETVKVNNLKILDVIYESTIGLYVKQGVKNQIQTIINKSIYDKNNI